MSSKTKICRFCGESFSEIDFPAQFERMVTCGNTECAGNRRRERVRDKEDQKKEGGEI